MPLKKRITSPNPLPPLRSPQPTRPIQPIYKKIKEEIKLPVPAYSGPVLPPKPKRTWWVLVLIVFFSALSVVALSLTLVRLFPTWFSEQTKETSLEKENTTKKEAVYSYTSVVREPKQSDYYHGTPGECWDSSLPLLAPNVQVPSSSQDLFLLFDVVLDDTDRFDDDLLNLSTFVALANKHKLNLTLFLSEEFAKTALERGVTEFSAWKNQGHEIALLFKPEEYFGVEQKLLDEVPYGSWLRALHEGQVKVEDLCDCSVSTWSGGESFLRIFDVGYDLNFSAYADLQSQFLVSEPWTPGSGGEKEALMIFNPLNSIVYIPSGVYPAHCVSPSAIPAPFAESGFSFVTKALYSTLEASTSDRINVFQTVLDISDFETNNLVQEIEVWNQWMTSVFDPLLKNKSIFSVSLKEVSENYFSWIDRSIGSIEFVEK